MVLLLAFVFGLALGVKWTPTIWLLFEIALAYVFSVR